ncbi:UbiH/UbiF family hydroxylase [Mameliella sediminis]|uniref:UbiH/UbiF family hydroxylase n=1 Tax=Mameliella sediminis TaxID=2836866 RepID=UPI001C484B87|nr:UbiH/UbiF family hydroxylase [Mameliella sediminis]MBV7393811.1 UbiH/UbiF family hydroxylase [Mameliella sediminis]
MDYDIVISGGGIAGLTAAAGFASAGFKTLCVDPSPPVTDSAAEGADLRTTAFLQPAQAFLDEIGLWPRLADHAMPLQVMRIVDAGGPVAEPRVTKDFDAGDISDKPFGWNLPNWLLRREMAARLGELANVDFRPGTGTTSLFTRDGEARVTLSDGSRLRCRLVIAADGRNSPMRQAADIGVRTTRFGQKALAFAVTHPIPHCNVSTEIHRTGGPFTLVPLPDHQGMPCSAVVWMEDGPKAERLRRLDTDDFEAEMSDRSCRLFGPLKLASRRTIWPIIAQEAERLSSQRLALIAEAAHVVPPIGAQGLNMSLNDIAALRDLAMENPETLGNQQMLDTYHDARMPDIRTRVAGITTLNRISQLSAEPLRDIRAKGLDALYSLKPVRRTLMQMGLGARS